MVSSELQRKELQAFMPTSNDALYAPANGSSDCTNNSSTLPIHSLSQSRLSSTTGIHLASSNNSFADALAMSSKDLPREQVASASTIPESKRLGHEETDEATWYGVYCRVLDVHERERKIWTVERNKLIAEKDRLEEEVARFKAGRNDSAVSAWNKQRAQDDTKVFFDAEMVKMANEKLAEISVVGGSSVDNSRVTTPSGVTITSKEHSMQGSLSVRRTSGVAPALSSIAEKSTESPESQKELRIQPPSIVVGGDGTADNGYGSEMTPGIEGENPYAPTSTAQPMFSPPPNYIMHAGHTPLAVRSRSARDSFASEIADSDQMLAPQAGPVPNLVQGHGDADPELKSPKILPTEPGDVNFVLETLESRLKDVSDHPDENKPLAVRKAEAMSDDEDDGSTTAGNDSPGGIKLKSGRKMNFGAQLGGLD